MKTKKASVIATITMNSDSEPLLVAMSDKELIEHVQNNPSFLRVGTWEVERWEE